MAINIEDRDDFEKKYRAKAQEHNRLYAMLLFDSRPSQKAVQMFAKENFDWIDEIARASGIHFFVCIERGRKKKPLINPSLEIASRFGIKPEELPGVLLFTYYPIKSAVKTGCYLRLKAKLFETDLDQVEKVFTDLTTLIREALNASCTDQGLMDQLHKGIAAHQRRRRLDSLIRYCVEGLEPLRELPKHLATSALEVFLHTALPR
jgi:hypothetical protein